MKKLMIASALALLGTTAMAQSSVSVYGIVDMGIQSYDNGVDRKFGVDSGLQAASRLGFKGVEDLGGGLKAKFVLESGIAADTGTNTQNSPWGREANVALEGGFGEVKLGLQYSPLRQSLLKLDPTAFGLTGSATNMWADGGVVQRIKNSVSYSTPVFNGFQAHALYGAGEVAGDNSAGRNLGLSASYATGPVYATIAYNKLNNGAGLPGSTTDFLVGGTYDFGVAKVYGGYGQRENFADLKTKNYTLAVSAPVSTSGTVKATWVHNDSKVTDAKSNQYTVSYIHDLSKRTSLYTSYGFYKNGDGASLMVAKPGENGSAFQVGMTHRF